MLRPRSYLILALLSSTAASDAAPLFWDGATIAGDPGGGAGTWSTGATLNWDTALTGGTGVKWTTNDAVFGGTAGVVTLGSAISATSLNFTTGGYTMALGTRVLTVSGGVFSTVAGNVFSITGSSGSAVLSGNGNLTSGQSVTLSSGILQLQSAGTGSPLGSAQLLLGGGTLNLRRDGANSSALEEFALLNRVRVTSNVTINVDRLNTTGGTGKILELAGLQIGAQTLTTAAGNAFKVGFDAVTLDGNATLTTNAETLLGAVSEIGGARTLTKLGTAALVFRETSAWTGGLLISAGEVEARMSGALGAGLVQLGTAASNTALTVSRTATIANAITSGGTGGTRTVSIRGGHATFTGDIALNRTTTVDVAGGSLATLSGALSGSTVLTKSGAGTLVLGNGNNQFGTDAASSIVVTGGLVSVDSDSDLGKSGNGVRLSGGGLLVTQGFDSDRGINLIGATNGIEVASDMVFGLLTTPVSGTGAFTKWGKGALRLDVAATATGGFTLGNGELRSLAPSGNVVGTGAVRLNYGLLTLAPVSDLDTVTLTTGAITLGGAVKVVLDNTGLTLGNSGNLLATLSTGALSRVDHGTAVVTGMAGIGLLGAPLSDGERWRIPSITTSIPFYPPYVVGLDSDVDESPHFLSYSASTGFNSKQSSYSDGFDPNPAVTAEIADVTLESSVSANESALAVRVGSNLNIDPGITLTLGGSSSTAGIILRSSAEIRGGRLSFGTREALVYVASNTTSVIASDIVNTGTAGGFTKFGPGGLELLLDNANGNLGEISVQDGELIVDDISALGTGTEALRVGVAAFTYRGANSVALGRPLIIGVSGGAAVNVTASTLTLDRVISGGVAGVGTFGVTFSGGGAVRLGNSANTFAGDILVDGTELLIAGPGAADPTVLGSGQKDIRLTNGAIFSVDSGDFDPLPDTKRWVIDTVGEIHVESGVFRLNDPNQLIGDGLMVTSGAGTLEIGDDQSEFLADVTIQEGTLQVSGRISGSVMVNTSATLAGTGTVGPVSVWAGGTLSPAGGAKGQIRVGPVSLLAGGSARFDIDSTLAVAGYDQVSVVGSVSLAGGDLSLDLGFAPVPGIDLFYLILNDGSDAVTGVFATLNGVIANLNQGAVFPIGGQFFQISYTGESGIGFEGVGNDVVLRSSSIPEPGSTALLFLGLTAWFSRRRVR